VAGISGGFSATVVSTLECIPFLFLELVPALLKLPVNDVQAAVLVVEGVLVLEDGPL